MVAVHRARAWLRENAGLAIESTPHGYVLRVDTDVRLFNQLRGQASAVRPSAAARLLGSALALWRGPALSDVDHPVAFELERHRRATVLAFGQALLDAGRAREAEAALRPVVADDPLDERGQALYLLALAASGRQSAALGAYEAIRRRLAEEFGIEPSFPLRRAHLKVLRHEMPHAAEVDGQDLLPVPAVAPVVQ
jgi:DNA-binding SARP family transcriptional activator